MAPSGDTTIPQIHTGIDSSNKTLLKSDALYKVRTYRAESLSALPH